MSATTWPRPDARVHSAIRKLREIEAAVRAQEGSIDVQAQIDNTVAIHCAELVTDWLMAYSVRAAGSSK